MINEKDIYIYIYINKKKRNGKKNSFPKNSF